MRNVIRKFLHRFVPSHFHDPIGLSIRLLRSRDPAARFAMETAMLGVLLTPLDLLLEIAEKRLYRRARRPKLPLIFVCGAPRTGTTLVANVLIDNLPVSFINNLTAVFPRSPIAANLLFGKLIGQKEVSYRFYYGKTAHLSGSNDGLHIWDRWLGNDRKAVKKSLTDSEKDAMISFFGACEDAFQKPMINKNNSLNICASLIAEVFENSYFLCLTREPAYLAQSLIRARAEIHGDVRLAYGVDDPHRPKIPDLDYIEDVCRQVLYHERQIKEQQQIIGHDRFWMVSYEEFCRKPEELVSRVSEQILRSPIQIKKIRAHLKPFHISNDIRIEPALFEKIQQTLLRLKTADSSMASTTSLN